MLLKAHVRPPLAELSLDYDGCEIISQYYQNRETPVING